MSSHGAHEQFLTYGNHDLLHDQARVVAWQAAIESTVKPGDLVAEVGCGAGVLSMIAAKAGAEKVYAYDANPEAFEVAAENVRRNGLEETVTVVRANPLWPNISLPPLDVIIVDFLRLGAGLFVEPQLAVVEGMRKYLKPDGTFLPYGVRHSIQAMTAQEHLYGLTFVDDHRWDELPADRTLSTATVYRTDYFNQPGSGRTKADTSVHALGSAGFANAVRITSEAIMSPTGEPTAALSLPLTLFLRSLIPETSFQPIKIEPGADYSLSIAYDAGSLPTRAAIELNPSRG
jgi:SAM-dependent methyltransferase